MAGHDLVMNDCPFDIGEPCCAMFNKKNELYFDPPVYRQRYGGVFSVLLSEKWRKDIKKIVEFGCAEFGLFVFLKRLITVEEICFVDIDKNILEDNIFRLRPLTVDYIMKRSRPLAVKAFMGNVMLPDYRLQHTDAVIAVELIEHLYPDVLEGLPYNIFSYIKPKLFIVSTPNVEFNVLFRKKKKFRHDDHKFEWTREQFDSWATNCTIRFPEYQVYITGVGLGPTSNTSFGYCSQIAIFVREDCPEKKCKKTCKSDIEDIKCICDCDKCKPNTSFGICTYCSMSQYYSVESSDAEAEAYYTLIDTIEHPSEDDTRTEKEILLHNLMYKINNVTYTSSFYYNEDMDRFEIPLSLLIYDNSHNQILSITELRSLLIESGYRIEDFKKREFEDPEPYVVCDNDRSRSESDHENSDYENSDYDRSYHEICNIDDESDWDM